MTSVGAQGERAAFRIGRRLDLVVAESEVATASATLNDAGLAIEMRVQIQ